jgi:hypothetical protein
MRRLILLVSWGMLFCLGAPAARAQEPPPATLSVSREVTLYAAAPDARSTLALSREVTLYAAAPDSRDTLALSREVTLYAAAPESRVTLALSRELTLYAAAPESRSTLALSRELTVYREFAGPDDLSALRIAAGFAAPTPAQMQFFNIVTDPPSTNSIDILDAAAIAIRAFRP